MSHPGHHIQQPTRPSAGFALYVEIAVEGAAGAGDVMRAIVASGADIRSMDTNDDGSRTMIVACSSTAQQDSVRAAIGTSPDAKARSSSTQRSNCIAAERSRWPRGCRSAIRTNWPWPTPLASVGSRPRLPEPDQQRPRFPRRVPRDARRPRHAVHRRNEVGGGGGARGDGARAHHRPDPARGLRARRRRGSCCGGCGERSAARVHPALITAAIAMATRSTRAGCRCRAG